MWEEDIMVKKVWDIPNYSGCNKWSDDGMLAILTASSIQVLTPTFNREKFYHARWIHLEHIGENEGPGKKPKPASSKESYTVSTGDDLIHWMTEVNRCEDRTFGKLDVNSLYFIKAVWSPPGLVMCVPSYLSALLSDGSVLLLAMGGASQSNRQIYNNGRKSVSNLFSMTIAFDIGTLFDVWMEKNGAHVKGKSQTERRQKSKSAANDSDSDSEEDNDDDSNSDKNLDDRGEEPQRDWKCMITEIASYPHLLSYRRPLGNRSTCMLLATGSSSGYINIWAIQGEHEGVPSVQGKDLRAECVCSALLAEPQNSSSYTAKQHSGHRILSITCMEFMISSEKCSKNFETRLLCGSYGGYFMIFDITSDSVISSKSKQTSSSSSSSSAKFHSTGNTRGLPALKIALPVRILRPFNTPIESIVVSSNEQNTVYLRSAARLVRVDLSTGTLSRLENIHSHILSTTASIETRSYSEGGDLLATCSLDGDVKLWEQPSAVCNDVTHSNNNLNKTQRENNSNNNNYINSNADEDILDMDDSFLPYPGNGNKGVLVILDENRVKPLHAQNRNLKFFQLLEMNKCYAGHPILDLTFDPLQLILVVTCLIPSTISDSREVQMNKNLEKAHCGISFFLSPILSLRWVVDCDKIEKVIRCAIFPMTKHNTCGEFKSVKNGIVNDRSSNGNKNKNSHKYDINENENGGENKNDDGNYYYNNSEECYLNRSSFCGLPFAWLRSFNEVVADLARGDPRTVPDVLTLEQLDNLGIVKEKKRVKGKKDKDDDDDGEAEDDSAPCRAGISDVAWRVKDLLYPNVDVLFHKSLHLVVDACVTISADLSSKDQGNDINVYDVNPVAGGNSHRQLLSVPTDDYRLLIHKIKLWQSLHLLLLAVPRTRGMVLEPFSAALIAPLKLCIQIGLSIVSAKRVIKRFQNDGSKDPRSLKMTPKEMMSLRFLKAVLEEWGVSQSIALGEMLSLLPSHSSSSPPSQDSGNSTNNNSSSGTSSRTSRSGDNSSSSSVLEEVCTVCGASILFSLPSKENGAPVCTSACQSCGTLFDRCCTTFLTIGFDALTSGNVLSCSVCSSMGLVQNNNRAASTEIAPDTSKRKINSKEEKQESTNKKKSRTSVNARNVLAGANDDLDSEAVDSRREFDWYWWDRKAPYCPYCSILMLPLV